MRSDLLILGHRHTAANLLFVGAVLWVSAPAWSMDLLQVYQAAQRQDATLLAARANAEAEKERLPQARSQMLPSLIGSVSSSNNQLESTTANFLKLDQTTNSNYRSGNKNISLRQPLFRPQLAAQYRQAQAQIADADATLTQEEQNLAIRVSSAYFEALLAHDQLALVLAQQITFVTQLDAARKTMVAGSGTRTDIDEAQARLDMNRALELEARQNVAFSLQQLQTLIDTPVDRLEKLNVAKLDLIRADPGKLEDWIVRAQELSPQLNSLRARLEVARQELEKARAGHYPTLDATVQWTQSESENVTSINSRYTNNAIGLQLNIPIFSGGFVSSTIRQSIAVLERSRLTLEAGKRDLALRVHREFRGVTEAIPKIGALEQALRSADQLVISSRRSLEAGSRTVLDILNAEQQQMLVQRDLAQARYQYLISRLRLLALAGEADIEAIKVLNRVLDN
jgi:TolC family type I secretion outer membrane protein